MHRKYHEPSLDVTLAVSLLKNPARFDYLVEKATELGVRTIIPLLNERTIPQHEKHDRFEKIALAAMKQCGRSWLPRIQPLQKYETVVSNSSHWPLKFIPHEKTDSLQSISSEMKNHDDAHSVLITIGPEGGFSEEEVALAEHNGFKLISLGSRRLRTETAAVVAMAELLK
jgi:16S rRNA (uracil1498-N3)-methyltransferase